MKYLTPQQILAIHDRMIKRFGGSFGVRDVGLMESACARPQASFDGEDLYKTIFEKSAALIHSLLKNHPFVDGNKRTSLSSAGIFLRLNGYKIINSHKDEVKFTMSIENESLDFKQIADWFKKNCKKI